MQRAHGCSRCKDILRRRGTWSRALPAQLASPVAAKTRLIARFRNPPHKTTRFGKAFCKIPSSPIFHNSTTCGFVLAKCGLLARSTFSITKSRSFENKRLTGRSGARQRSLRDPIGAPKTRNGACRRSVFRNLLRGPAPRAQARGGTGIVANGATGTSVDPHKKTPPKQSPGGVSC